MDVGEKMNSESQEASYSASRHRDHGGNIASV